MEKYFKRPLFFRLVILQRMTLNLNLKMMNCVHLMTKKMTMLVMLSKTKMTMLVMLSKKKMTI